MSQPRPLSPQTMEARRRSRRFFAPPVRMSTGQWAEKHRRLASGASKGNFRLEGQPALRGILAAIDDPSVRELWCQKSAQFGWTQGVVLNVIFRLVHIAACAMMVLFPKDGAAKKFNREKLEPGIRKTPVIAERIELGTRSSRNSWDFKEFDGGYLQLAGTNVADNVKSTDADYVFVEEPNDTKRNVQQQGEVIVIARERIKATGGKMLVGGTPTIADVCKMEEGMQRTDKRRFFIQCPHCDHDQSPTFWQVKWLKAAPAMHPIYGYHQVSTARYACEACFTDDDLTAENYNHPGLMTQAVLYRSIRVAAAQEPLFGWRATATFTGNAGFYVNDMISLGLGARMSEQATKFLEASHDLKKGDDRAMIAFYNNQQGLPFRIKTDAPEIEVLRDRSLPYKPFTCPAGGLVVLGFVDVQRGGEVSGAARLEWRLRAYGRGEESWLVARGECLGNPLELAPWIELDKVWKTEIQNVGGGSLGVSAVGIDSGDGMTAEAVYRYVRSHRSDETVFMATKGVRDGKRDIYSPPKQTVDTDSLGRAAKWGVKVYIIGTERGKDLFANRLKLTGDGPGRIHWYEDVGDDYFKGITAEVKIPDKSGRKVWTVKAGWRNEDLDCEVGMLHGARRLRLHTWTDKDWDAVEMRVRQRDLLNAPKPTLATLARPDQSESPPADRQSNPFGGAQPFTGFR